MTLKIAFQMDDISSIKIVTDTTFLLMLEAQGRGYEIYYYLPKDLILSNEGIRAKMHKVSALDKEGSHYKILETATHNLIDFDVIFMRQDPPFDMSYITTTYILEMIKHKVLILNDPSEVRNNSEKLFTWNFKEFIPETVITSSVVEIKSFHKEHKEIVVKPLYSFGGDGFFAIREDEKNIDSILEIMLSHYKLPIIAQKFIPEVVEGDTRILFVDGEVVGGIRRVPVQTSYRSNLRIGGKAYKFDSENRRHQEICEALKEDFKRRNLFLVGIDIIGDYLTEINVTSPTGYRVLNNLFNCNVEKTIWDKVEEKLIK